MQRNIINNPMLMEKYEMILQFTFQKEYKYKPR